MSSPFRFGLLAALCLLNLPQTSSALSPVVPSSAPPARKAAAQPTATYDNVTITEDLTLRGIVVIKGSLTVAPQATLRIEPGCELRFIYAKGSRQLPRLVVMGRIHAAGSADRPVLFSSYTGQPARRGEWSGITLLASEKRNLLENCRIEGAVTGLEARFSTVTLKSATIGTSLSGLSLHDSNVAMSMSIISDCDTAIDSHDSELDIKDTSVARNRRGAVLFRSSVAMSGVMLTGNSQHGILAEEGRLRLSSCELSGNGAGAYIKGGEGQLFLTRFLRNNDTALHLTSARLKITRCQIAENLRDGVVLDDDRATLWGNSFSSNGGYNLVNAGQATVSALNNWWGAADEASVKSKLQDAARDPRSGAVQIFPWLIERPALPEGR